MCELRECKAVERGHGLELLEAYPDNSSVGLTALKVEYGTLGTYEA